MMKSFLEDKQHFLEKALKNYILCLRKGVSSLFECTVLCQCCYFFFLIPNFSIITCMYVCIFVSFRMNMISEYSGCVLCGLLTAITPLSMK